MELTRLKEASTTVLDDVNSLLTQLLGDDSKKLGTLDDLKEVVSNNNVAVIVVKDGEKIIGMGFLYFIIHVGRRTGHIEDVVVDSSYRGQGLGEKIMQELISTARKNNLETLYLTSRPVRIAANKLYQKIGFTQKETNVYKLPL